MNQDRLIFLPLRKKYHENYLRFVFETPEGPISINRNEEVGKYLHSRVRYCDPSQSRSTDGESGVWLLMPSTPTDLSRNHFLYYSADDIARINDYIESSAYLEFRLMVQAGVHDLKMNRKLIIELFSDLILGTDRFEALKKDEYRKRKKIHSFIRRSINEFNYK
jgi:hypothetical protein